MAASPYIRAVIVGIVRKIVSKINIHPRIYFIILKFILTEPSFC